MSSARMPATHASASCLGAGSRVRCPVVRLMGRGLRYRIVCKSSSAACVAWASPAPRITRAIDQHNSTRGCHAPVHDSKLLVEGREV